MKALRFYIAPALAALIASANAVSGQTELEARFGHQRYTELKDIPANEADDYEVELWDDSVGSNTRGPRSNCWIYPSDDTYVNDAYPNGNAGGAWGFYVGDQNSNEPPHICRIYLKFDISLPPEAQAITSATIHLYEAAVGPDPDIIVGAHYLSDDSWTEGGITWANSPKDFAVTATDLETVEGLQHFYSWDVTSDVQTEWAGDGVYSVVMVDTTEDTDHNWAYFDSMDDIYIYFDYQYPRLSIAFTSRGLCGGDADCEDNPPDPCLRYWCNACDPQADSDGCLQENQPRRYADVYPVPEGDGAADGFDILCVLDAANDINAWGCLDVVPVGYPGAGYMAGDIYPCGMPDGAVEGLDILAVLDAANDINWCADPCP